MLKITLFISFFVASPFAQAESLNDMISQQEFDTFHKKMFGKIDHDHNGILNENELKEFKRQKKLQKK